MGVGDTTKFYNFFGADGLSGGLNVTDDPLIVSPKQMVDADNISITQTLSRKKRPGQVGYHLASFEGTASYPNQTDPIRGILQYHRFASSSGDVKEDIFLHQSTKVWSIESRTSAGLDRTGAAVLSAGAVPRYQVAEGILYFTSTNAADGYYKWNGLADPEGDIESATPPSDGAGTLLGTWFGRMVMAGNPDFPYRVYISAPYDSETWDSVDGGINFDLTYDGEPGGITAIFPEQEGRLFVATSRSVYELTATNPADVSTFRLRRVTRGIGCVSQSTVVSTANDILFCSTRGLHSMRKIIVSDQSDISFLSRDVQRLFTDLINPLLWDQAKAEWDEKDNIYILTVPSAGQSTNDIVLAYNINFDLWLKWTGLEARSFGQVVLSGKPYVLKGGETGKISYLDSNQTQDLGEGFAASFKSGKFFPDADITHVKEFVSVTALITTRNPSTVNLAWSIDDLDYTKTGFKSVSLGQDADLLGSTFILGTSKLGRGRYIPVRVGVNQKGYNFQLEVTASGDSDIEFHGWILEVSQDENTTYS